MRKIKKKKSEKVIVAISGGIDSSVAAALLKNSHFNIVGVFMKFWAPLSRDGLIGRWNRCCSPQAEKRARKVAQILDIPFYVLNFEKEFKERVVNYFLEEYKKGRTPNPCIVCNKEIKFGLLLEKALALGADFVATGHYTKTNLTPKFFKSPAIASKIKKIKLLRGEDREKDQSYFLWQLNQKQLKHILFPIGNYTKKEVRNFAKKFKLPVLNVPESQEICFIQSTVNDFLAKYLKPKPGPIVESQRRTSSLRGRQAHYGASKIIGQHQGLHFYTIGQRKGLGIPGGPWYVIDKDVKNNILIVSRNEKDLEKKELIAENVNWISGEPPKLPLKVKAKIRYRHNLAIAEISRQLEDRNYIVRFAKSQRAITPGQSVVFYKGEEILGGGIIQ